MRTELEIIEKIERYLTGQLSAEEKAAFERQLAADPDLREALRLQEEIMMATQRISARQSVQRARRHYLRTRHLVRWGGLGLGLIAAITLLICIQHSRHSTGSGFIPATTDSFSTRNAELYTIDPSKDTVLHTLRGALLNIPHGTLDAGGALSVRLEIKEAYSIVEMINNGLETRSNGQPLSSGGMISIDAAPGQQVSFKSAITVSIPTNRLQQGMQVYKGKIDDKGKINWTDPVSLADTSKLKDLAIGRSIFESNCAQCHNPLRAVTGPGLAYIGLRRDRHWLYSFIHNNQRLMASGDQYSNCLFEHYNKTPMNIFPDLSNKEIDQLLDYVDNESLLADSNTVPDYKKQFDSCVLYNRLADSLTERRSRLIGENGQRTDVNWKDRSGKLITATHTTYVNVAPVVAEEHPSIYYKFTVESFGWYNVDVLVHNIPEAGESVLRVHIRQEYSGEVNVFFVMPGRKILNEGGLLEDKTDEFGFLTQDGKIPLPQGEQAYVFATGEYKGQLIFGIKGFVTGPQQSLELELNAMTKEGMNNAISRLAFDRLSITAADSKNAAALRATDTTLAAIARFKPKDCNCNCGIEGDSEKSDTIYAK